MHRRLPKRGFKPLNKIQYTVVNLDALNVFEANTLVDKKLLKQRGFIKQIRERVKILGRGNLKSPLKIEADAFSRSAREKIATSGGEVILGD